MEIRSSAFEDGMLLGKKYSYAAENSSPPLSISGVPESAKSLALICDDPDTPIGTWVHWVVWNIDPKTKEIPERAGNLGVDGNSDFKKPGYNGPHPPPGHGTHRYFFKLYALDSMLPLKMGSTKKDLEEAMEGHILEKAELMGTYER
jgi:hypothetical protein